MAVVPPLACRAFVHVHVHGACVAYTRGAWTWTVGRAIASDPPASGPPTRQTARTDAQTAHTLIRLRVLCLQRACDAPGAFCVVAPQAER